MLRTVTLRSFQHTRFSHLWRLIYLASTVLVLPYVFFDVLDLDLSNFPLKRAPLERTAVVAEVEKVAEDSFPPPQTEHWVDLSVLFPGVFEELVPLKFKDRLIYMPLDFARAYRVALPRSSTTDASHHA